MVYAKRPFGGPKPLAYLARYTHRVAIANSRLIGLDEEGVTFQWKDDRIEGRNRSKVMTLAVDEFIRRFLIHVLPGGFHRIRHYGLFANGGRAHTLARARELLDRPVSQSEAADAHTTERTEPATRSHPCPCCGGRMIIIETFARGGAPRYHPTPPGAAIRIDTHDAAARATMPSSPAPLAPVPDRPRWRSQQHAINAGSGTPTVARRSGHNVHFRPLAPANLSNHRHQSRRSRLAAQSAMVKSP